MRKRLTALFRDDSLRGASLRSSLWTISGFGGESILRLGANLILTRLLAPDMFGLMALAMTFVTGVALMSDLGTSHSVVRSKRGDDPDFLATAWSVQVMRGCIIATASVALAWPLAQVYEQPELFLILAALSFQPLIAGFNSVGFATQARKMQLGRVMLVNLAAQATITVVMILFALALQSVWALVVGTLMGAVAKMVLSHLLLERHPIRFHLEREALGEIIRFGRWVLLSTLFTFLGGRGITAVHGALVPLDVLGVLAVSTVLIRAFETLVQKLLTAVGFSAFARVLRERPEDLPKILANVRNKFLTVCVLGFVLVSFISQPLIDFLYDERYALAGSFLAIQALNGGLRVLVRPYQEVMLASGDSRLHAAVMFCSASVGILGTIAGYFLLDIYGMLAGMGLAALVVFGISASFAHRRGYANLTLDFVIVGGLLTLYAITLSQLMGAT
ncbi:MAG: oligosaccharide flippase family protein [Pseudomonadota bacterium]